MIRPLTMAILLAAALGGCTTETPAPPVEPAPPLAEEALPPPQEPAFAPREAPLPATIPSLDLGRIEATIHKLVNRERRQRGLPALRRLDALATLARRHSEAMATHNFFDHTNHRGASPGDRARQAGISCGVGENIYMAYQYASYQTTYRNGVAIAIDYEWKDEQRLAEDTVTGWMNSPSHRANLLHPDYTAQGIGAVRTDNLRVYVTQNLCDAGGA